MESTAGCHDLTAASNSQAVLPAIAATQAPFEPKPNVATTAHPRRELSGDLSHGDASPRVSSKDTPCPIPPLQHSTTNATSLLRSSMAPQGSRHCDDRLILDSNWNFHDSTPNPVCSGKRHLIEGICELADIRLVGQSSRLLRPLLDEKGLRIQPDITPANGYFLSNSGVTSGLRSTLSSRKATVLWLCLPHMGTDHGSRQDRRQLNNLVAMGHTHSLHWDYT